MNHSLRAAIVGTGFMSWVHVEALRRLGIGISGIVGSSPEKSRQAAERLSLPRAYESYEACLADEAVDVVHLVTPNQLHFPQAQQALQAGKHVMCEKPLAIDQTQTAALVDLARAHPQQLAGVNYNMRFYPLCQDLHYRLRDQELGQLFHITGSYVQDWLLYPHDYNWRVDSQAGGPLRVVADIGTHWLDLIQFITGDEVRAVCADLKTVYPERQKPTGTVETFQTAAEVETEAVPVTTEDCGSISLRFASGAIGQLFVSQVYAGRKNCLRFEIAGSSGSAAWNSECPNEIWRGYRDQPNAVLLRDPSLLRPEVASLTDYPGGHNEGYDDSFKQCFRAFYNYLSEGDFSQPAPFPTFADGHREVQLCEAVLQSHQQAGWVELAPS